MSSDETTQFDNPEATPGAALAVGSPVRVPRLDSVIALRGEAARLYRECRKREGRYPDAMTGQRLANILGTVRTALELSEIAERLARLEALTEARR
jgi:hypothetical protein